MWGSLGLNQGPTGYESAALTTELLPPQWKKNHTQVGQNRQCKKFFGLYKPVRYRDVKGDPAWAASYKGERCLVALLLLPAFAP